MATLNISAPDGKTLHIQVPEGTDPSQYDQIVEQVIEHYKTTMPAISHDPQNPESMEFERSQNMPHTGITELGPSVDVALAADAAPKLAIGGAKLAAKGISSGLEALPEGGEMISKLKGMLPNPSLKGLGYGSAQVGTEAQQNLAKAAQEYATRANPDIGELVAKAGQTAPEDTQALVTRAANNDMVEPIQQGVNTEIFNKPIAEGMSNSAAQMRDITNEQWKQAGEALDKTLQGLNRTGVKYDPSPVLKQVESMYFKDVNGSLMKTGWQGEANQAISDALESVKDYANGQKIGWDAANQIKGGLQDSASYAAKRFDQANEAYKTVASLIKEDIDNQAAKVLSEHGGDVKDFQSLRDAYSKLSSLKSVLNPAAGKELLQPSLAESVVGRVKQALPLGLTTAAGMEAIRRIF